MHIYRCQLTLMEKTFFSSREISTFYQTEPLIGNYALAYALDFCRAPYFNPGVIYYHQHLSELNKRGLYLTPATIRGQPRFLIEQFNAQPDAYWSAMGAGVLVTRPDGAWMEQSGKVWYVHPPTGRRKKVSPANRPQFGRIRFLAVGNKATFYLISRERVRVPGYVRLGKFMSKAQVVSEELGFGTVDEQDVSLALLLNPADFASETELRTYDLITVPPTPLVRNARMSGSFYRLDDGTLLPAAMRFGVERLPE